jgi:hypothetical protein
LERRNEESKNRTFEVLSVLACFVIISGILVWGFSMPELVSLEQRIKRHAQILGYSLWQIELNRAVSSQPPASEKGRGLASLEPETGVIGRDPWGRPYSYILNYERQLLLVWSYGPNGKDDSSAHSASFYGDDLGSILDLKMKQ